MTIHMQAQGGRYPCGVSAYRPEQIRATLQIEQHMVRVRIDDNQHPDRWEELVVDRAALLQALLAHSGMPVGGQLPLFDCRGGAGDGT